ncbi:MAG: hypothetical protein EXR72_11380 [Myxococcales bacterium]|nr:hypothetical protein [Myxococcales bacterium]
MNLGHLVLLALPVLGVAGCGGGLPPTTDDNLGPFTGAVRRFVIDRIDLPLTRSAFADDLDGDGKPDNQFGNVIGTIAVGKDAPLDDLPRLLGSGRLAPLLEVVSDDAALRADDTVGVTFIGAAGAPSGTVGGTLVAGAFTSNRTRLTHLPVATTVHLPLYTDSDPIALPLVGVEIELRPDGAGFTGVLHGAIRAADLDGPVLDATWRGLLQMIDAHPDDHRAAVMVFDRDHDGKVSFAEFRDSAVTQSVRAPDVRLVDAAGAWRPSPVCCLRDALSVGFGFHAVPAH